MYFIIAFVLLKHCLKDNPPIAAWHNSSFQGIATVAWHGRRRFQEMGEGSIARSCATSKQCVGFLFTHIGVTPAWNLRHLCKPTLKCTTSCESLCKRLEQIPGASLPTV
eukprot:3003284-Amphidinium_carterae.1